MFKARIKYNQFRRTFVNFTPNLYLVQSFMIISPFDFFRENEFNLVFALINFQVR